MSSHRWRWWLAGLGVYLTFLIGMLPAAYPKAWLHKRLPTVQLARVSGTIWSGMAQELVLDGRSLGTVHWRFDWQAPFGGHIGYRVQLRGPGLMLHGRVSDAGANGLLLQNLRGRIDVRRLNPWLPLPPNSLNGTLDLRLTRMNWLAGRPTYASGTIDFTTVSLNWPQAVTLGSYALAVQTTAQAGIHGMLTDTGGPLILKGTLEVRPEGHYQVQGTLKDRSPGNDPALDNMLRYLPSAGAGAHRFEFHGRW